MILKCVMMCKMEFVSVRSITGKRCIWYLRRRLHASNKLESGSILTSGFVGKDSDE